MNFQPERPAWLGPRALWLGVHDALSARIAARAGAHAVWVSSYGVSAAAKAVPDASIVGAAEMLAVARECCHGAGDVPVVVDCDTGYGDATTFAHAVAAHAGGARTAAVSIEDKTFPKRNALEGAAAQGLEPVETLERALAAARGRRRADGTPLLIGRTEALLFGRGVEECVARLRRYAAAGADALLIQTTGPLDELLAAGAAAREATGAPVIAVPTSYPDEPADRFFAAGFDVVVRSHQLLQAAVAAQTRTVTRLLDPSIPPRALAGDLAAHESVADLVRLPEPNGPIT